MLHLQHFEHERNYELFLELFKFVQIEALGEILEARVWHGTLAEAGNLVAVFAEQRIVVGHFIKLKWAVFLLAEIREVE